MGDYGISGSPDGGSDRKRSTLGEAPDGGEEEVLKVEDNGGDVLKKRRGRKPGKKAVVKRKGEGSGVGGVGGPARKRGRPKKVMKTGENMDFVAEKGGENDEKTVGSGGSGDGGGKAGEGVESGENQDMQIAEEGAISAEGVQNCGRQDGGSEKAGEDVKSGDNEDLMAEKSREKKEKGGCGNGGSEGQEDLNQVKIEDVLMENNGEGGEKGKVTNSSENVGALRRKPGRKPKNVIVQKIEKNEDGMERVMDENGGVPTRRCNLRPRKEVKFMGDYDYDFEIEIGEEDGDKKMTRRGPKKKRGRKSKEGPAVPKNDRKNEDFAKENGEENPAKKGTEAKTNSKKSKNEALGELDDEKKKEPSEGALESDGYFLTKDPSSVPQKLSRKEKMDPKVRLFYCPNLPMCSLLVYVLDKWFSF